MPVFADEPIIGSLWLTESIPGHGVHAYPYADWQEHILTSTCSCKPKVSMQGMLVTHNAFDGREMFEKLEDLKQVIRSQ